MPYPQPQNPEVDPDDADPADEADHGGCIEPHRTIDGYQDCDGKPL